ncbi:MAG: hypothetical protein VCE43_06955, partial [Myxococcota bacterium]
NRRIGGGGSPMSKRQSGLHCTSIRSVALLGIAALALGQASVAEDEPVPEIGEPRPPDILELVQVAGSEAQGSVSLEAVVRPVVDGEVEIEVLSPTGLRFASSASSRRFLLRRGGAVYREPLQVDLPASQPVTVRIRARLLDADGQPWLSLDRELQFNQPSPDPSRKRIPVVRTAPDGSRSVEYMERDRAERSGLLPNGSTEQSGPLGAAEQDRAAPAEPQPDADSPATPIVQE